MCSKNSLRTYVYVQSLVTLCSWDNNAPNIVDACTHVNLAAFVCTTVPDPCEFEYIPLKPRLRLHCDLISQPRHRWAFSLVVLCQNQAHPMMYSGSRKFLMMPLANRCVKCRLCWFGTIWAQTPGQIDVQVWYRMNLVYRVSIRKPLQECTIEPHARDNRQISIFT